MKETSRERSLSPLGKGGKVGKAVKVLGKMDGIREEQYTRGNKFSSGRCC
jgi:hypothetical protein